MEFRFETVYDQNAFTQLAKALRKTVRAKRSRRSHIFGVIVVIVALLLVFLPADEGFVLDLRAVVTLVAAAVMVAALIWEDTLNGYVARKRTLPGMYRSTCLFLEDGYSSVTEVGKTEWTYDKIGSLAETDTHFVFIFSASHGQLYDKKSLSGGTEADFRVFIERKTGKQFQFVK